MPTDRELVEQELQARELARGIERRVRREQQELGEVDVGQPKEPTVYDEVAGAVAPAVAGTQTFTESLPPEVKMGLATAGGVSIVSIARSLVKLGLRVGKSASGGLGAGAYPLALGIMKGGEQIEGESDEQHKNRIEKGMMVVPGLGPAPRVSRPTSSDTPEELQVQNISFNPGDSGQFIPDGAVGANETLDPFSFFLVEGDGVSNVELTMEQLREFDRILGESLRKEKRPTND